MIRFQLVARAGHYLDLDKAKSVAKRHSVRVRECYPMMGSFTETQWLGTNQPRTISFSAKDQETADLVALIYSDEVKPNSIWQVASAQWRTKADYIKLHSF